MYPVYGDFFVEATRDPSDIRSCHLIQYRNAQVSYTQISLPSNCDIVLLDLVYIPLINLQSDPSSIELAFLGSTIQGSVPM